MHLGLDLRASMLFLVPWFLASSRTSIRLLVLSAINHFWFAVQKSHPSSFCKACLPMLVGVDGNVLLCNHTMQRPYHDGTSTSRCRETACERSAVLFFGFWIV